MKILLVDDEKQLVSAINELLKTKFSVDCAYNGEDGLDMALTGIYDVIVLDIMMPKLDGYTVLKRIRENKINTPILMLSAKSQTEDKILGLNLGADDYLTKPFSKEELLARINALLRRKNEITTDLLKYNDIELDRNTFKVYCGQNNILLGKKEFQILEMLILNKGKIINKEKFIEKIWGYDTEAEYNTIEVYLSFLRRKLSAIHSTTEIKSIRGVGYLLGEVNG